jgi:hypothetical protein
VEHDQIRRLAPGRRTVVDDLGPDDPFSMADLDQVASLPDPISTDEVSF